MGLLAINDLKISDGRRLYRLLPDFTTKTLFSVAAIKTKNRMHTNEAFNTADHS